MLDTGATQREALADASAYAQLRRMVKDAGLLKPQPMYYVGKFITTAALLVCGLLVLFGARSLWLQALDAVFLAFVSTQISLLGHDVAHHEVFHNRRVEAAVGLILGNLLMGVSVAWWTRNHNAHHSRPNDVDHDPAVDFQILAFSPDQARSKTGVARFFVKHQALFLIPLFSLVWINLHQQSVRMIFGREAVSYRRAEVALMGAHPLMYCLVIFLPLGFLHGIVFILIHKLLTGLYLGSIFAPNHKGMPVLDSSQPMGFLHRQVLTSRNVRGDPVVDFWYGGLNYQIEHHLFPAMPRNRLSRAQSIVKSFCATQGILYHETGVVQSYREILQSFREVSLVLDEPGRM